LLRDRQPAILYANCDDKFTLCVNGKEALQGAFHEVHKTEISLRAGDVLTARCEDTGGAYGFACVIVFPRLKQAIVTNLRGWKCYTPAVPAQWAAPGGVAKARAAGVGTAQNWRVDVCKAAGFSCLALWGDEPSKIAYLTLKVSDDYLIPADLSASAGASAPPGAPAGAQWAMIQAICDDAFLLAVNGEVVLAGAGSEVWKTPMPLRVGDTFAVRCVDNQGGLQGGFACAIVFPGRKKAALTDLQHWKSYTPRDPKTWYAPGTLGEGKPVVEGQQTYKSTLQSATGLDAAMIWSQEKVTPCYLTFKLTEDAFVPEKTKETKGGRP
jgi:hypothetical protein